MIPLPELSTDSSYLTLTNSEDPTRSDYHNDEGPAYQVNSHFSLFETRRTTIDRVAHEQPTDGEVLFESIAEIEWHSFHPTVIKIGGVTVPEKEFFRQGEIEISSTKLMLDKIFTGPDNIEYRWVVTRYSIDLYTNDQFQSRVATYHREYYGFVHDAARPAALEITPLGSRIIEHILITFVYVFHLKQIADKRRDRRDRDKHSHRDSHGRVRLGVGVGVGVGGRRF